MCFQLGTHQRVKSRELIFNYELNEPKVAIENVNAQPTYFLCVKGKSPVVPFHGITSPYSYFEEI